MKKFILLGALLVTMGLAVAPAIAQTQSTTTSTTTTYVQSTAVVGARIKDSRGEEIGVIRDFVLDRNTGCLAYVVIATGKGGVLTTSSKTVAAPWAVFSVSPDPKVYVTRIERERIYSAPVWESTRVEEYSRTDYLNNVYSYYGVPAPRFNAEMSMGVTNTTTTGTTSTTNATAAPSMTAASPAGGPPTPAATAAASPLGAAPPSSPAAAGSPKAHTHTHNPAKETSSPPSTKTESVREKKPTDEPERKSEKTSTKRESASEKSESSSESPNQPSKKKQPSSEPGSAPEAASTPKQP